MDIPHSDYPANLIDVQKYEHSEICSDIPTQKSLIHPSKDSTNLPSFSKRPTQPTQTNESDFNQFGRIEVIDHDDTGDRLFGLTEDSSATCFLSNVNFLKLPHQQSSDRSNGMISNLLSVPLSIPDRREDFSSTNMNTVHSDILPRENSNCDLPVPVIGKATDSYSDVAPSPSLPLMTANNNNNNLKRNKTTGKQHAIINRSHADVQKTSRHTWKWYFGGFSLIDVESWRSMHDRDETRHGKSQSVVKPQVEQSKTKELSPRFKVESFDQNANSSSDSSTYLTTHGLLHSSGRKKLDDLAVELGITNLSLWKSGVSIRLAIREKDIAAIGNGRVKLEQIPFGKGTRPELILEGKSAKSRRALMFDSIRTVSDSIESLAFLNGAIFKEESKEIAKGLMENRIPFLSVPVTNTAAKTLIFLFDDVEQRNGFVNVIVLLKTYYDSNLNIDRNFQT